MRKVIVASAVAATAVAGAAIAGRLMSAKIIIPEIFHDDEPYQMPVDPYLAELSRGVAAATISGESRS